MLLVGSQAGVDTLPPGTANQTLRYNGTTGKWEASSVLLNDGSSIVTIANTLVVPTIYGGTATGNNLSLRANSTDPLTDPTPAGVIQTDGVIDMRPSLTGTFTDATPVRFLKYDKSATYQGTQNDVRFIHLAPAWTVTTNTPGTFVWVNIDGTVTATTNNLLSALLQQYWLTISTSATDGVMPMPLHGLLDQTTHQHTGNSMTATPGAFGELIPTIDDSRTVKITGTNTAMGSSTFRIATVYALRTMSAAAGSTLTMGDDYMLWCKDNGYAGAGTVSITTRGAVLVENITVSGTNADGGTISVGTAFAVKSQLTSSAKKKFSFLDTGGAPSQWIGVQIQANDPTSQTIPTDSFVVHGPQLTLASGESITMEGNSHLVQVGNV